MARVNHKLVKQRLNEHRSKISDRQFFSSRLLAGHFEDLAAAQTKRYHYNRRVRVNLYWKPKQQHLASTDDLFIRINTGHPMVTSVKGRENRYQIVCGLFAHELGHVLYTDFLATQTYMNSLARYNWYPCPPDLKTPADADREKAFWAYLKAGPKNLEMVQLIAHHISNVIEDGYIENRMLANFPGTLGYGLERLRERCFESIPTVTQLKEKEEDGGHIFESILQLLLSYANFGEIKYGDEPLSDERIQTVFGLISDVDDALMSRSGRERLKAVNTILIRCWDMIESYCEECRERQQAAEAAGGAASAAETLSELLQSIAGSSGIGSGKSVPVSETPGETPASTTAAARAKTHAEAEKADKSDSEEDAGKAGAEPDAAEADAEAEGSAAPGSGETPEPEKEPGPEETPETPETEETDGPPEIPEPEEATAGASTRSEETAEPEDAAEQDAAEGDTGSPESTLPLENGKADTHSKKNPTSEEGGRIPWHQSESLSEPVGGTVERNDDYEQEQNERAAADIERLLDRMAEKEACEQLENERLQELNEAAQNISYGNIHEGVSVRINRITSVNEDLVEQYDSIAAPLVTISRQLQKSITKQLQEQRRGGKLTGLVMGRRLDAHALCRNDGKVFYKNSLPNEIPELAVGLLLDESGSMGWGDRCTYARAAAIILHDFCESLEIPVMVYGHSTGYRAGGDTVELYSYAEFEGFDRDDKYRLMDIGARESNRDGAALRFVAEQLAKRPEAVKMLILVSDGQPADCGYGGSAAEEDLRGIQREYRRKGILFVAAAIGDDKPAIERIYGDSFLDISDLNQLPTKLTAVVKRHIRV